MIAIVCALLSIVTFGIVFALIPLFELPENFTGPARWFVFGQGIYTVAMVILAPMLSMYYRRARKQYHLGLDLGVCVCD